MHQCQLPLLSVLVASIHGVPTHWRYNTGHQGARRTASQAPLCLTDQHLTANRNVPQYETLAVGGIKPKEHPCATSFHSRPLPPPQQLLTNQPQIYAQHKGLGGADWIHVSSFLWFSREYSSYFCSTLKALEIESIGRLSPYWGQGSWDGWTFRSHGCPLWGTPAQKPFVCTDDGRGLQTPRAKSTTLPVNRYRCLISEEGATLTQ